MKEFLSTITNRGATPALIATMTFNEARLRVMSENVANIHTPGYRARQLDARSFQHALRRALDEKGADARVSLDIRSGDEVRSKPDGRLSIRPSLRPVDNALFHDGTNLSLEREMAELAETGMMHELAATLLRGNFERVRTAIRGAL